MKKLLVLTVVIVFTISNAFAQNEDDNGHQFVKGWEKGNWYVSGSAAFGTSKQGDAKDDIFTFMPQAGYFIKDDLVVGLGAGYMSSKNENGSSEIKSNTFMVGPFAKWFCSPEKQFSPFFGAQVNYLSTNNDNGSTDFDENGFDVSASLGFNYWLSDCLTLKAEYAALTYQTTKVDAPGAESRNTFGAGLDFKNISFGVGLRF